MINLNHEGRTPLYLQIYEQVREEILNGAVAAGSKLPPIRILAADLRVSRNTVEAAYTQLTQEGFVSSHPGSGYIVQDIELLVPCTDEQIRIATKDLEERFARDRIWSEKSNSFSAIKRERECWFDFTYDSLPPYSFPAQIFRKLINEVLSSPEFIRSASYPDPLGEHGLREQIAHYLQVHRGVHCHPAQVVVQPGTQASLYNLLTLFDPQQIIAMEEPGYDGVRVVFENAYCHLFPIPVLATSEREYIDAYYASDAKLAYITPSNQFPTGRVLQLPARQALLNWARRFDAYLIEDDYCCEYRYNMRPLPSLQSLDRNNRVIYMGTFSKALSPSLRMSYLVLPPDLLFEWNIVFARHYSVVPGLNQMILEAYMRLGHWEKRIRKARAFYKRKYHLLKSSIQETMGERVDVVENGSGLHLLIGVRDGRGQSELIECALARKIKVYDTNRYWMAEKHAMESYVLLGFSAIEEERIAQGIKQLAKAWFGEHVI